MITLFLRLHFVPQSLIQKLRRIDWLGSALFIASSTSFIIPLTWGGVMYPWSSWRTLVPLTVGVCGLISFVLYEKFCATEPVIRLSVFGSRTGVVTYIGTFVHGILVCLLTSSSFCILSDYLKPNQHQEPLTFFPSSGPSYTTSPSTTKPSKTSRP